MTQKAYLERLKFIFFPSQGGGWVGQGRDGKFHLFFYYLNPCLTLSTVRLVPFSSVYTTFCSLGTKPSNLIRRFLSYVLKARRRRSSPKLNQFKKLTILWNNILKPLSCHHITLVHLLKCKTSRLFKIIELVITCQFDKQRRPLCWSSDRYHDQMEGRCKI